MAEKSAHIHATLIVAGLAKTKEQKDLYGDTSELRETLHQALTGKKYKLDCGNCVTFCHHLGNKVTISHFFLLNRSTFSVVVGLTVNILEPTSKSISEGLLISV
jgi:hypothetical protein